MAALHCILCLMAVVSKTIAIPAVPTMFTEQQPNGMPITLRLQGDESQNWLSDLNGYPVLPVYQQASDTVAFSSSNSNNKGTPTYVYAAPSASSPSGLIATQAVVGQVQPETVPGLVVAAPSVDTAPLKRRASKKRMSRSADATASCQTFAHSARPLLIQSLRSEIIQWIHQSGLQVQSRRRRATLAGDINNLVVMVRWSDHVNRTLPQVADLEQLFNSETSSENVPTGSIKTYFARNSYGKLRINSILSGWITVSVTEAKVC